jgi:hypothetical protein
MKWAKKAVLAKIGEMLEVEEELRIPTGYPGGPSGEPDLALKRRQVIIVSEPSVKVPDATRSSARRTLIATDVISDGTTANDRLSRPPLAAIPITLSSVPT